METQVSPSLGTCSATVSLPVGDPQSSRHTPGTVGINLQCASSLAKALVEWVNFGCEVTLPVLPGIERSQQILL